MAEALALVTGAASGIGLEIARCFARDAHALIMTGDSGAALERAADDLRRDASGRVETVIADLVEPEGAARLYHEVNRAHAAPDFLVHGTEIYGDAAREPDLDAELDLIQLNVVSVVQLTRCFACDMVARGSGRILITSSIAGMMVPAPKPGVYAATKAFELAFAEAMAHELEDTGVTVTALAPVETGVGFPGRAMAETPMLRSDEADIADVARAGYDAMMKGSDHVVAPFAARTHAALTSVLPACMMAATARPH